MPHAIISRRASKKRTYKNNHQHRLARLIRGSINTTLRRQGIRKTHRTIQLLGCTFEFFKNYFESLFLPGMTWENRGYASELTWQIGHVVPVRAFDLTDPQQIKLAWHYTNLKPQWWRENSNDSDWLDNGKRAREMTRDELNDYLISKGFKIENPPESIKETGGSDMEF
jgi:hypothetical protein